MSEALPQKLEEEVENVQKLLQSLIDDANLITSQLPPRYASQMINLRNRLQDILTRLYG